MQPICVHGVWGVGGEEGGCLTHFIWMSCSPQGVVCTLQEGDDFGKLALVNDAPRAASIVLREDNCHFLRVDKEDFNRILRVSWEDPLGRRTFYFFPSWRRKGLSGLFTPQDCGKEMLEPRAVTRACSVCWCTAADIQYFSVSNTSTCACTAPFEWTIIAVALAKHQSLIRSFSLVLITSFLCPFLPYCPAEWRLPSAPCLLYGPRSNSSQFQAILISSDSWFTECLSMEINA